MYKVKLRYKFKYKKLLLAALYVSFLLAETSEFFEGLNYVPKDHSHESIEERHLEMPSHVPEDAKVDLVKYSRKKQNL